jgi:hypothetical protein
MQMGFDKVEQCEGRYLGMLEYVTRSRSGCAEVKHH